MLNRDLLPGNECFGCGHHNEHGLKIQIRRDEGRAEYLVGSFAPTRRMEGFPGIIHGGVVYSALDCMAAWTATVLRPDVTAIWILRSANVRYLRPVFPGSTVRLVSGLVDGKAMGRSMQVSAEALDETGEVLVSGHFDVVAIAPERFVRLAGIDRIPSNWERFLAAGKAPDQSE